MKTAFFLLVTALPLANCAVPVSEIALPAESPDVRAIVSNWLASTGPQTVTLNGIPTGKDGKRIWTASDSAELSAASQVLHYTGPAWRACLRTQIDGKMSVYAVFVDQVKVVDVRAGVVGDDCANETYTPLVLRRDRPRPRSR